jgi:hypothetical protein
MTDFVKESSGTRNEISRDMSDNEIVTLNICLVFGLAYMNTHASKFNVKSYVKSNQFVALPSDHTAFYFVLHAR